MSTADERLREEETAADERLLLALITAAAVLTGCGQATSSTPAPGVTLAPPTPAGMEELPPEPVRLPATEDDDCNRRASLRPFGDRDEADAAVRNIRDRGRLIVGLDIGSNLFSFRDPITGEITGFDVDIAGEIARDIFGSPAQVEYRIMSSADRIAALQNNQVDVVVKTMTITCERKKLVNFSTVYLTANQRILAPRSSAISQASDLSGKRVCVVKGTTSLRRIQQISPSPIIVAVVTWADCLVALQQRQVDAVSTDDAILAGLVGPGPVPAHRRAEHERGALRHRRQPAEHRTGALRQRHPRAGAPRRDVEHAVPQVVDGARSGSRTSGRKVRRLMPAVEEDEGPAPSRRRWTSSIRSRHCGRWRRRRCSARTSTTPTASRCAPRTPTPTITRRP